MNKRIEKPVLTLRETDTEYQARIGDIVVIHKKDETILKNGVSFHPRIMAINEAVEKAGVDDYYLFNV